MSRSAIRVVLLSLLLLEPASAGMPASAWQLKNPTSLMLAAQEGDPTKVQVLLDKGENVNQQTDKSGATPLIFAASAGRAAVVKLLLARGANPNLCSWGNVCPLWWAAHSGSYETTKLLMMGGAKVNNNPDPDSLEYPVLQEAVDTDQHEIIKLLLDHGAEIDYTNFYAENTALAMAVMQGKAMIAQTLIERGADLTFATEVPYSEPKYYGGRTALEIARKENHKAAVEVVESALKSGKYPKYTVESIANRLYKDPEFDLSAHDKDLGKFLRIQTNETLRLLRNAIFARKNYKFDDPHLTEYFSKRFPAYRPLVHRYDMSDVDKRNVQYIKEIEEYRAARDAAG